MNMREKSYLYLETN